MSQSSQSVDKINVIKKDLKHCTEKLAKNELYSHYHKKIKNHLENLGDMEMTVCILHNTKIGKIMTKYERELPKDLSDVAKKNNSKWKILLNEYRESYKKKLSQISVKEEPLSQDSYNALLADDDADTTEFIFTAQIQSEGIHSPGFLTSTPLNLNNHDRTADNVSDDFITDMRKMVSNLATAVSSVEIECSKMKAMVEDINRKLDNYGNNDHRTVTESILRDVSSHTNDISQIITNATSKKTTNEHIACNSNSNNLNNRKSTETHTTCSTSISTVTSSQSSTSSHENVRMSTQKPHSVLTQLTCSPMSNSTIISHEALSSSTNNPKSLRKSTDKPPTTRSPTSSCTISNKTPIASSNNENSRESTENPVTRTPPIPALNVASNQTGISPPTRNDNSRHPTEKTGTYIKPSSSTNTSSSSASTNQIKNSKTSSSSKLILSDKPVHENPKNSPTTKLIPNEKHQKMSKNQTNGSELNNTLLKKDSSKKITSSSSSKYQSNNTNEIPYRSNIVSSNNDSDGSDVDPCSSSQDLIIIDDCMSCDDPNDKTIAYNILDVTVKEDPDIEFYRHENNKKKNSENVNEIEIIDKQKSVSSQNIKRKSNEGGENVTKKSKNISDKKNHNNNNNNKSSTSSSSDTDVGEENMQNTFDMFEKSSKKIGKIALVQSEIRKHVRKSQGESSTYTTQHTPQTRFEIDSDGFAVPQLLTQNVIQTPEDNTVILKGDQIHGEVLGIDLDDVELESFLTFSQIVDDMDDEIDEDDREYLLSSRRNRNSWNHSCKQKEGVKYSPLVKSKGRMKAAHKSSVGKEVVHKMLNKKEDKDNKNEDKIRFEKRR